MSTRETEISSLQESALESFFRGRIIDKADRDWDKFIKGLEKRGRRAIERTTGLMIPGEVFLSGFVCGVRTELDPKKAIIPVFTVFNAEHSCLPKDKMNYAVSGNRAKRVKIDPDTNELLIEGKKVMTTWKYVWMYALEIDDFEHHIRNWEKGQNVVDFAPEFVWITDLAHLFVDSSTICAQEDRLIPRPLKQIMDQTRLMREFIKLARK